jgi:cytochrome c5
MNQRVKRLVLRSLSLFIIAPLSFALTADASRFNNGLACPPESQRPRVQTSNRRQIFLSLWATGGVREELSDRLRIKNSLLSSAAVSFALSQRVRRQRTSMAVDLFRTNCARCHGADGRGDTPLGHTYNAPDFTDPDWWRKHPEFSSAARLVSIVNHGKGGMPAFVKKLKPSEVKALVNYVRRFRKQ